MILERRRHLISVLLVMLVSEVISDVLHDDDDAEECGEETVDCNVLLSGQFLCLDLDIDPATQQLEGCMMVNGEPRAPLRCTAIGQYLLTSNKFSPVLLRFFSASINDIV